MSIDRNINLNKDVYDALNKFLTSKNKQAGSDNITELKNAVYKDNKIDSQESEVLNLISSTSSTNEEIKFTCQDAAKGDIKAVDDNIFGKKSDGMTISLGKLKSVFASNPDVITGSIARKIEGMGSFVPDSVKNFVVNASQHKNASKINELNIDNLKGFNSTQISLPQDKIDSAISFNSKQIPMPVVKKFQEFLGLKVTGVVDKAFVMSMAQWQQSHGLEGVDGQIGPKTIASFASNGLEVGNLATGQYPRYEKLFKDGLLNVTIGIGFDETGANPYEEAAMMKSLKSRGYVEIDASSSQGQKKLKEIYDKANKPMPPIYPGITKFYYKPEISTYNGKPVDSVINLVTSGDGKHGDKAVNVFKDGLRNSDVVLYGGHGRYGTGPDFDSNFTVTIPLKTGAKTYDNYENLEKDLKNSLKTLKTDISAGNYNIITDVLGSDPKTIEAIKKNILGGDEYGRELRLIKMMVKAGKAKVDGANDGNVPINFNSPHKGEFGGFLMQEALKSMDKNSNITKAVATDDKYRLWYLNGCRTSDYQNGIRSAAPGNPSYNTENLDVYLTNEVLIWPNTSTNLLSFLDGVTQEDSSDGIKKRIADNAMQWMGDDGNVKKQTIKTINDNIGQDNPSFNP